MRRRKIICWVCLAILIAVQSAVQSDAWAIGAPALANTPAAQKPEQKAAPPSKAPSKAKQGKNKPKSAAAATSQPISCNDGIRVENYEVGHIYHLRARRGYASQIQLASGDTVDIPPIGGDSEGWEVGTDIGATVIAIKPKREALASNLIIRTRHRSYVIALDLVPEMSPCKGDWELIFRLPVAAVPVALKVETPEQVAAREAKEVKKAWKDTPPARNWAYSMQALPNSEDIIPTEAYDDGRFTYIRIPGNREVPSVFRIAADGTESFVERHMQGRDLMVIHEVARRWVLRLDKQTVGLWNDDFELEGAPPVAGTASERIKRVVRGGEDGDD